MLTRHIEASELPAEMLRAGIPKGLAWGWLCEFILTDGTELGGSGLKIECMPGDDREHECDCCPNDIDPWMMRARVTFDLIEPDDPGDPEPWSFMLCEYCMDDVVFYTRGLGTDA